ncbi:MAG: YfjI family protein [Bdellovibrio sp.]
MSNNVHSNEKPFSPSDLINKELPEPLYRELIDAEEFPLAALGEILSKAAAAITESIQAPSALVGQSLLAAVALVVQGLVNIEIDGRHYPASLFFLTIGQSGERKSAVDSEVLKPHREYEKEQMDKYREDFRLYKKELEQWEDKKRKNSQKAEQVVLGPPPQEPPSQILLMDDPTLEGLQKNLATGRPSIGLFSDEGGRTIGGHGMNNDNQLKTAAGFCSLWDGSSMSRIRAGEPPSKIYNKRLSIHLMIQPHAAETFVSNRVLQDQGILSRCLISKPKSTVGTRAYKQIDLKEDRRILNYRERIRNILEMPLPVNENNELMPRTVSLSKKAKEIWIAFHNDIETKLKEDGEYYGIRGFGAKAAEQALRISGVITIFENVHANEVPSEVMLAAIAMMEYYLSEALRIQGISVTNPDLINAKKLYDWLKKFDVIYPGKIYQHGPNFCRDKKSAENLIEILKDHGYLESIDNMQIDGSLRKKAWRVKK